MRYAKLYSAQTAGLEAHIIDIEVDLSRGLHAFSIVGLPDKAVEEARDRIGAAIKNSGFTSPKQTNQKVVISLAPADLRKEGPSFDVGMALGYLLAADLIRFNPEKKLFLGELSLDGAVRRISGTLPLAKKARDEGFQEIYLPEENAPEGALIEGLAVFAVRTLSELIDHINEKSNPEETVVEDAPSQKLIALPLTRYKEKQPESRIDFSEVKGQEGAKRALEIAAAGRHNIVLSGPAGTGKTMLAKAFPGILPSLSFEEALEATAIHSVSGLLSGAMIGEPPFRAPHHSSSYTALVGGGARPFPGEITLAHRGVLFLDEFAEFDRRVIDALREPLEEREIRITRTNSRAVFPADFILLAALNPCPCGNYGIKNKTCRCNAKDILRYRQKISGPIADRIDLWIEVATVDHAALIEENKSGETSETIRKRVTAARERQLKRLKRSRSQARTNAEMTGREVMRQSVLTTDVRKFLVRSAIRLDLSARACHRIIKVARTIADLAGKDTISEEHILEALQYRKKEEDSQN